GDLFRVALSGGTAARLTTFPGHEDFPKLSPDGRWIAFRAAYDGPQEVYLMPAGGGMPKRLTYTGDGQPVAWTPDGKRVVFRSGFESTFRGVQRLYSVSTEGELPERLPPDRGVLCSFSPDGTKMAYNRRGNEEYYWKRYKGGQYQDVWLYDFATKAFTPLTDYVGKNSYPMWSGGSILFVSDRSPKGIANLYRLDPGTKAVTPVTAYEDFDVQMPSSDGKTAVFVRRRQVGRLRGPRRRLPRPRRRGSPDAEPDAGLPLAGAFPADLAGRQARGVLLGQDGRVPALPRRGLRR
ncbi:MAG: hypothetical protein DYH06_11040, partial [Acidobacteria bacterium ACB2]|nr:hypothetical protein [Acidobacteria bacterium ACB2]